MLHRPARLTLLLLAVLCAAAQSVAAQTVQGRIVDAETDAPVVGAIVKAMGPTGDVRGGTLTADDGSFTLIPDAGLPAAALSVERIGYDTEIFPLADARSPAPIELRVRSSAVQLSGITVTAESYCDARFGAGSEQMIWDEARKSLEITALSQATGTVIYETEDFDRDLRPSDYAMIRGYSSMRTVESFEPYSSLTVDQMTQSGWIQGSARDGMEIFGPSAPLLLSDEFANQHCFRAEVQDDAILLHFVPNARRRSLPEIEGTLRLDRETAELTRIDFSYVRVPDLGSSPHAGGTIRFFGAPNGLRVVRDWVIRGPEMSRTVRYNSGQRTEQWAVERVHEQGGRVLAVQTPEGRTILPTDDLLDRVPVDDDVVDEPLVQSVRLLRRGDELLLTNRDNVAYRVTEVILSDCENTVIDCDAYPIDVEIPPGETRVVFRVNRGNPGAPVRYRWEYRQEVADVGQ